MKCIRTAERIVRSGEIQSTGCCDGVVSAELTGLGEPRFTGAPGYCSIPAEREPGTDLVSSIACSWSSWTSGAGKAAAG